MHAPRHRRHLQLTQDCFVGLHPHRKCHQDRCRRSSIKPCHQSAWMKVSRTAHKTHQFDGGCATDTAVTEMIRSLRGDSVDNTIGDIIRVVQISPWAEWIENVQDVSTVYKWRSLDRGSGSGGVPTHNVQPRAFCETGKVRWWQTGTHAEGNEERWNYPGWQCNDWSRQERCRCDWALSSGAGESRSLKSGAGRVVPSDSGITQSHLHKMSAKDKAEGKGRIIMVQGNLESRIGARNGSCCT